MSTDAADISWGDWLAAQHPERGRAGGAPATGPAGPADPPAYLLDAPRRSLAEGPRLARLFRDAGSVVVAPTQARCVDSQGAVAESSHVRWCSLSHTEWPRSCYSGVLQLPHGCRPACVSRPYDLRSGLASTWCPTARRIAELLAVSAQQPLGDRAACLPQSAAAEGNSELMPMKV